MIVFQPLNAIIDSYYYLLVQVYHS